jgi:hypothetical protein
VINDHVFKDLDRALTAFRKNLGSTLGGNAENELKPWTAEVLAEVKRRNAANGTILTIPPTDLDSVLRKRDRSDLAASTDDSR